jgi:hypothetical protein
MVDFDLLKMHPLNMDAGMGAPDMFFKGNQWNLDQFIATTLAYGHIGFMDWSDMSGALKIYYIIQQVQKRYTLEPIKKIEYERDGKMMNTSQALAYGDEPDTSRVHVIYGNDTEIWMNASDDSWTVKTKNQEFELPKWGYLASREEDGLLAYSTLINDEGNKRRVDCSFGTDQYYADSRGSFVSFGQIGVEGSGVLKKDYGKWWVIPTTQFTDFAFSPSLAKFDDKYVINVIGCAEDGSVVGSPETRWNKGLLHILPGLQPAFKYEIRQSDRLR